MEPVLLDRAPDGCRTFALVFASGDDVLEPLIAWLEGAGVRAGSFTALGAFARATVGYFDLEARDYVSIPVEEQVEVLSLVGNVSEGPKNEVRVHAHAVLGCRDGSTRGGHLLEARVRPTLEVMLAEHPWRLRRRIDPATGLPLLVPPPRRPVTRHA